MTVREAISHGAGRLSASEQLRSGAQRDASLLLMHTLGFSRAQMFARPERALTPDQQMQYEQLIARRLTHEPIQYITGQQEFYGLSLRVTPAVLIPRPETEHLVEAVLAEVDHTAPLKLVDIGTGSGAIAIVLAHHLPHTRIAAVDISPAALELAAENAAHHRVAGRIRFVESDLLEALAHEGPFDAII